MTSQPWLPLIPLFNAILLGSFKRESMDLLGKNQNIFLSQIKSSKLSKSFFKPHIFFKVSQMSKSLRGILLEII